MKGACDGLRYFIVALPEPSINYQYMSNQCQGSLAIGPT